METGAEEESDASSRPRRSVTSLVIVAALLCCAACGAGAEPAGAGPTEIAFAPGPGGRPRLILFIVIDQGGARDLLRYRSLYHGGLARLLDTGALFTDAHHEHAVTVTAAGHAALATGSYPSRSGIIDNEWFDRTARKEVYCVEDETYQRSPANLRGTALGDWLKDADGASKVFAASGKDRAAVLMGGHTADGAFWYDVYSGRFTSSGYYPESEPAWLKAFNDRELTDVHFGTLWNALPLDGVDLAALDILDITGGPVRSGFPHAIGSFSLIPDAGYHNSFFFTPFVDDELASFATTLIDEEDLGGDEHLDLLALGFSALDTVGHTWGPNSREFVDTLLHLDRSLGDLLDHLDAKIGRERLLVTLSADHGVLPLPEYLESVGRPGRRTGPEDIACVQQAGRVLEKSLGAGQWILKFPYLNYSLIAERNLTRQQVEDELVRALTACAAVRQVWTRTQMESNHPPDDPIFRLYTHSFDPARSGDLFVQYQEGFLATTRLGTNHGSPYSYDTHVPVLIAGPGVTPGPIAQHIATVDVAPTVAALIGVAPPGTIDGVDRSALLRRPAP
ncbi:MAG: alkaline phosphatase family protein [Acidobacteriota bacterium]